MLYRETCLSKQTAAQNTAWTAYGIVTVHAYSMSMSTVCFLLQNCFWTEVAGVHVKALYFTVLPDAFVEAAWVTSAVVLT